MVQYILMSDLPNSSGPNLEPVPNDTIEITANGVFVEIEKIGAYVSRLEVGGTPLLYDKSEVEIGDKIKTRGGMHVCLPNFGPDSEGGGFGLNQHGFGRDLEWRLTRIDESSAVFELPSYPSNTDYPPGLRSTLIYDILPTSDSVVFAASLILENISDADLRIAPGFHPYFEHDGSVINLNGFSGELTEINPGELSEPLEVETTSNYFSATINGKRVNFIGEDLQTFIFWSDNPAEYICIEPTQSGPDFMRSTTLDPRAILEKGETSEYTFGIEVSG